MTTAQFKASLEQRGFFFQADGEKLFVLPTADLTTDEVVRIKADKPALMAMLLPCLVPDGNGLALFIPRGTDRRNQWWRAGSRTIWDLLAELDAPADTVRRYTSAVEKLHSGQQQCGGRVVELDCLRYCVVCGWREEKKAETLAEILGF